MRRTLLASAVVLICVSAHADQTANVPKGDPAMAAAFRKAAATLDQFLAAWRRPPAGAKHFALKVGLLPASAPPGFRVIHPGEDAPGQTAEYFWIGDLRETREGFEGVIRNEPEVVKAVKSGQTIDFKRAEVADWTYFQNGKIVGNATACPALAHASANERRDMREQYGLTCD